MPVRTPLPGGLFSGGRKFAGVGFRMPPRQRRPGPPVAHAVGV